MPSSKIPVETLRRVPFFSHLNGRKLRGLIEAAAPMPLRDGRTILEGLEDLRFFVVAEGRVTFSAGGRRAVLGPGDFFAAMAAVDGRLRPARARARGRALVFAVTRERYEKVFHAGGRFVAKMPTGVGASVLRPALKEIATSTCAVARTRSWLTLDERMGLVSGMDALKGVVRRPRHPFYTADFFACVATRNAYRGKTGWDVPSVLAPARKFAYRIMTAVERCLPGVRLRVDLMDLRYTDGVPSLGSEVGFHEDGGCLAALTSLTGPGTEFIRDGRVHHAPAGDTLIISGLDRGAALKDSISPTLHCAAWTTEPRMTMVVRLGLRGDPPAVDVI